MTNLPTQTPWKRIVTAMAKNPPTTAEEPTTAYPLQKQKNTTNNDSTALSAPCGNQSSPPTDEHPFISRRNHTHLTQKASRVLVSKVAFGCREYGAKRSS
jgi:hypothetical protein